MKPSWWSSVRIALMVAVLGAGLFSARDSSAQGAPPTPEQRRQAGAAFDQAVAARSSGDHANAASLFETADRLAPSAQALGNAVREHHAVNQPSHEARAATLALRLLARHGDDARVASYANRLISDLSSQLHRVQVSCSGCDLEVDGALSSDPEFFLEPGEHHLVASWTGGRTRARDLTATGGGRDTITLEPPAAAAATSGTGNSMGAGESERPPGFGNDSSGAGGAVTPPPPRRGGFTPVPAIIFGVITVGLGATLIWSGVDTLNGVPAYMMNPTPEGLMQGQARELRTNILIGATAGAGALTLVFTIISAATAGGRSEAAPASTTRAARRTQRGLARASRVGVFDLAPSVAGVAGLAPGLTLGGRF